MKRWIKVPGPGDFRGEGKWKTIEEAGCALTDWEWNVQTGYLPTAYQEDKPNDNSKGYNEIVRNKIQ